ncbi:hypothetical protein QCA50_004621 [Cerrena zonata]|uniref:Homeobox domain-containing protein n=1 Tax=Cerrena zonata TaxID=2478898 RepID=A0AAW0GUF1_9APHY
MDLQHGVNGNAMDSLQHHHNHSPSLAAVVDQQQHSHPALYHVPPSLPPQQQLHHRYSQQFEQQQLESYDFPQSSSAYPVELDVDPLHHPLDSRILPISRELRQGPHPSLLSHPNGLPLHHPGQLSHIHPHRSNTCIPSLIPPGMDPAQVDMRTFYPYQPNEVKHRKRTTRSQLKVLEDVYSYDTKPNASLRKKLAEELGMTPRGVQVWFQNRRAKTKSQARKAEQGGKKEDENSPPPKPDVNGSTNTSESSSSSSSSPASSLSIHRTSISSASSVEDEASSSPTDALAAADDAQSVSSGSQTVRGECSVSPPSTSGTDAATSPTAVANANDDLESGSANPLLEMDNSIWTQPYPFGQPPAENAEASLDGIPPDAPVDAKNGIGLAEVDEAPNGYLNVPEHLRNQRRTSLPIIVSPPSASHQPMSYPPPSHLQRNIRGVGGLPPGFDPGHRRRSVDTNMLRLSAHPYAYAMAPPGAPAPALYGRSISSGGQSPGPNQVFRHGSMPHVFGEDRLQPPTEGFSPNGYPMHAPPMRRPPMHQRMSMPAPVLQKYYQQYQMHTQNLNSGSPPSAFNNQQARYGIPSREIPALIPGPLPSRDFSFGTAGSTSPNVNDSSPNLPANSTSSSPSGPSSAFPLQYPMSLEDPDTEDDASAVSSMSRFGSFTSMAGSDTSLTSAWCSDSGSGVNGVGGGELKEQQAQQQGLQGQSAPEGFDPDLRRASCVSTSGQFLEMFDGLGVGGGSTIGTPQPQNTQTLSGDGQSPNALNEGGERSPAVGKQASTKTEATNNGDGSTLNRNSLEYGLGTNEDSDGGNTLLYSSEYQELSAKGVHDFSPSYQLNDPAHYNGGYTADPYSSYGFSAMMDGNGNPVYDTGAIELQHMCVPSSMAMENFNMSNDSYPSYS